MSVKKSDVAQTLTLNPTQCAQAIHAMSRARQKRAKFHRGQPGISKSQVSQQTANSLGVAFADIRLSQMDPTDLRGIPYQIKVGNIQGISWSAPLVLPRDLDYEDVIEIDAIETTISFYNPKGDNGIYYCQQPIVEVTALDSQHTAFVVNPIVAPTVGRNTISADEIPTEVAVVRQRADRVKVIIRDADGNAVPGKVQVRVTGEVKVLVGLEEFNSAPPSVQAAAYQLILDRRLGEYVVPDGCYLMAMGNRDSDKGVTFKMPTPIMNRFVHIEMKVDVEGWLDWAAGARLHEHVVGYIGSFPEDLNKFDVGTAARGFQTPRSWEFVSDILYDAESACEEQVLTGLIVGAVGDAGGVKFMDFRRIAAELPKADDILSGKLKVLDKKVDVSLAYAMTTTLCYRLVDEVNAMKMECMTRSIKLRAHPHYDEWSKRGDTFLGFIMANFRPEIAIMGGKAALSTYKLPFDTQRMPNFQSFADQYKKYIL